MSKIKTPSLDLFKNTKNKINDYYKKLKKERENQKKKDAKRKILEEKKELKLQKKLELFYLLMFLDILAILIN